MVWHDNVVRPLTAPIPRVDSRNQKLQSTSLRANALDSITFNFHFDLRWRLGHAISNPPGHIGMLIVKAIAGLHHHAAIYGELSNRLLSYVGALVQTSTGEFSTRGTRY